MVTIGTSTDTIRSIEKWRIDTASKLTDNSWTEQKSLFVNRLSTVAGPGIDIAELEFNYGIYADQKKVNPLDLERKYVRIILRNVDSEPDDPTVTEMRDNAFLVWYGIIEVDERDAGGTRTINGVATPTGNQKFTAYGLLRELELTFVTQSVVEESVSGFQTINRGIPFNLQAGGQYPDRGNSSKLNSGPAGTTRIFGFAPFTDDEVNVWDAFRALEYTLEYDTPKDINGDKVFEWRVVGLGLLSLDWFDVTVERDRRSVKDIIDDLIDRRRIVGYYVYGVEDADGFHARISIFTFNEFTIDLGANQQIAANSRQFTLDFESSFDVEVAVLSDNSAHRADVVFVRGAPITTTFSCFRQGGFLEAAWSPEDETRFLEGAKNTPGYDALSEEDKQKRNQVARSQESLKDVYSKFVIADNWDLIVPDDILGDGSDYWVGVETPTPSDFEIVKDWHDVADDTNVPAKLWHKGKRFLRFIPIREDDNDDLSEYLDPFVLFLTSTDPLEVWEFGDRLNTKSAFAADDDVRQFSTRLIMLEKELGIRIEVGGAGAQQLIALEDWILGTPETTKAEYDPETTEGNGVSNLLMIVTVALEWDDRVIEKALPSNPDTQAELQSRHAREMWIDVPDARLDFLLPGTVTDIDDAGALVQSTDGEIIRDDRFRLLKIALVSAEWFGVKRQALQLRYRQLRPPTNGTDKIVIGDLITSIGAIYSDPDVNSVVTSIVYEMTGSPTTTVETSYAHLDISDATFI